MVFCSSNFIANGSVQSGDLWSKLDKKRLAYNYLCLLTIYYTVPIPNVVYGPVTSFLYCF